MANNNWLLKNLRETRNNLSEVLDEYKVLLASKGILLLISEIDDVILYFECGNKAVSPLLQKKNYAYLIKTGGKFFDKSGKKVDTDQIDERILEFQAGKNSLCGLVYGSADDIDIIFNTLKIKPGKNDDAFLNEDIVKAVYEDEKAERILKETRRKKEDQMKLLQDELLREEQEAQEKKAREKEAQEKKAQEVREAREKKIQDALDAQKALNVQKQSQQQTKNQGDRKGDHKGDNSGKGDDSAGGPWLNVGLQFEFKMEEDIKNIILRPGRVSRGRQIIDYHGVPNACTDNYPYIGHLQQLIILMVGNKKISDPEKFRFLLNCLYLRYADYTKYLSPSIQPLTPNEIQDVRTTIARETSHKVDVLIRLGFIREDELETTTFDQRYNSLSRRNKTIFNTEYRAHLDLLTDQHVAVENEARDKVLGCHRKAIREVFTTIFFLIQNIQESGYIIDLGEGDQSLEQKLYNKINEEARKVGIQEGIETLVNFQTDNTNFNSELTLLRRTIDRLEPAIDYEHKVDENHRRGFLELVSNLGYDEHGKLKLQMGKQSSSELIRTIGDTVYEQINNEFIRRAEDYKDKLLREGQKATKAQKKLREIRNTVEDNNRVIRRANGNSDSPKRRKTSGCRNCKCYLSKLSLSDLKHIAKQLGCKNYSSKLKLQLIKYIMSRHPK